MKIDNYRDTQSKRRNITRLAKTKTFTGSGSKNTDDLCDFMYYILMKVSATCNILLYNMNVYFLGSVTAWLPQGNNQTPGNQAPGKELVLY